MKRQANEDLENFLFGPETTEDVETQDVQPQVTESAWHDPDDDNIQISLESQNRLKKLKTEDEDDVISGAQYEQRLRDQFVKLQGKSNWAHQEEESGSDDDSNAILRSATKLLHKTAGKLPSAELAVQRLPDANQEDRAKCVLQIVKFHPNSELLMTAGIDKTLRLFHIDGEDNSKMTSCHVEKFPISSAVWLLQGSQILMTGDKYDLKCYDVETNQVQRINSLCGRNEASLTGLVAGPEGASVRAAGMFAAQAGNGYVHLGDSRTKQLVRSVKMCGKSSGVAFHQGREAFFTSDTSGQLYEWDTRNSRCLGKIQLDTHCISSLAMSHSAPHVVACGTPSGVIDFISVDESLTPGQKPFKSLMNLTMDVTTMAFHPKDEVFAASCFDKQDQLKMWHRPTYTCFRNWPTQKTPLGRVSAIDFSSKGGHMAIGNDKGRVLLYNLSHYY